MSDLTFQREVVTADFMAEARPLMLANALETGSFPELTPEPDVAVYCAVEQAGMLRCYTARQQGVLVAYASWFLREHPHYRGSIWAAHDVLFLAAEARQGLAGVRLLRFAEQAMAADGAQYITMHSAGRRDITPVLERMGYVLTDQVFARRVRHGS